jgi:hypothetical protein
MTAEIGHDKYKTKRNIKSTGGCIMQEYHTADALNKRCAVPDAVVIGSTLPRMYR